MITATDRLLICPTESNQSHLQCSKEWESFTHRTTAPPTLRPREPAFTQYPLDLTDYGLNRAVPAGNSTFGGIHQTCSDSLYESELASSLRQGILYLTDKCVCFRLRFLSLCRSRYRPQRASPRPLPCLYLAIEHYQPRRYALRGFR